jgi:hypothetical protein
MTEFEKKRAQLLRDIEAGGIDVGSSPAADKIQSKQVETQEVKSASPPPHNNEVEPSVDVSPKPKKQQSKLDLASTRRLLFNSLGVRTPKTKEDEARTREKLTGKTKKDRVTKPEPQEPQERAKDEPPALKPLENWRDVLELKATECIYENVELSEPPFPFVQRWNEADQEAIRACRWNGTSKGKKRKRKSRLSSAYDGADEQEYDEANYFTAGEMTLDYGEDEHIDSAQVPPSQKEQAATAGSDDDLPSLPSDLSSLGSVKESDLRIGAVIAFKQLDMSKETNWQPVISDYKTAIVEDILDGSTYSIRLANRDRVQHSGSGDESDGPRVYSKFEMPGYDEVDGEDDDGTRIVAYSDLIEPKLIRPGNKPASTATNDDEDSPRASSLSV